MRIFRQIKPSIHCCLYLRVRAQIESLQKVVHNPADIGKAVRIAVKISQHHIVFGVNVSVFAVFGKDQWIQKELIFFFRCIAEQGAASTGQSFFFDFAQRAKQFLPGLAQDDFLGNLELGNALAVFQSFLSTHAFITIQQSAAAFQRLRKLRLQFDAEKLGDGQPGQ